MNDDFEDYDKWKPKQWIILGIVVLLFLLWSAYAP
jgi:hypothetical protein